MTPADLAAANVGMVYAIASAEHHRIGGEYDELVGDGMVGLVQAAQRFDPSRFDVPFITYARTRVVGAMLDGYRRRYYYGNHGNGGFRGAISLGALSMDDDAAGLRVPPMRSAEDEALGHLAAADLCARVAILPTSLRDAVEASASGHGEGALARLAEREGLTQSRISQRLREARRRLAA